MPQNNRHSAQVVPLIGRKREITLIRDQLTTAMTGQSRVVLLSGEAGIGKSHLLAWAQAESVSQEVVTLRGGASEAEGMPSYLLFLEALGPYILATAPEVLRDTLGVHAAVLAEIFPEIMLRLGETPLRFPLPPEQARLRLYEAVGAFLSAEIGRTDRFMGFLCIPRFRAIGRRIRQPIIVPEIVLNECAGGSLHFRRNRDCIGPVIGDPSLLIKRLCQRHGLFRR